ncbi:MAG: hypothetical protein IJX98_02210 [Clostridia bacterium]|nr:hypothetical protein [Clostridia bacterium]
MNHKLVSYLGFCVRSGKIVYGVDDIEQQRKGVYLLLMDRSMGESSQKTVKKAQEKFSCPLIALPQGALGELLHKPAVKAVAIKEKNLAAAIVEVAGKETDFNVSIGGNDRTYGEERL